MVDHNIITSSLGTMSHACMFHVLSIVLPLIVVVLGTGMVLVVPLYHHIIFFVLHVVPYFQSMYGASCINTTVQVYFLLRILKNIQQQQQCTIYLALSLHTTDTNSKQEGDDGFTLVLLITTTRTDGTTVKHLASLLA